MSQLLTDKITVVCGTKKRGKTTLADTYAAACVEVGGKVLLIIKTEEAAKDLLSQTIKVADDFQLSLEDYLVWNKAGSGEGIFEHWNFNHILDAQVSETVDSEPT
jgi:KaiC/GvpD/RAD55 family RecA-like ATPase